MSSRALKVHEVDALTSAEVKRRDELEATIAAHVVGFTAAGEALAEIRDERLYRDSYATFEDYCKERWGVGRRAAYQLIDAAGDSIERQGLS